jgi:RNA polymerase sigma-70 factor, ECF subfamily
MPALTASSNLPPDLDLADLRAVVLRTALVLTHNRADAEDLVQIALMRALDRCSSFDAETNWRAWLKTVVRHLAVDLARRNQRWRVTELLDSVESPGLTDTVPEAPWADVSPEQLQEAVESIDENYQVVYRLHHVEGASYQQMAEQLKIPVRTVGTRLHRARGRIRGELIKRMEQDGACAIAV